MPLSMAAHYVANDQGASPETVQEVFGPYARNVVKYDGVHGLSHDFRYYTFTGKGPWGIGGSDGISLGQDISYQLSSGDWGYRVTPGNRPGSHPVVAALMIYDQQDNENDLLYWGRIPKYWDYKPAGLRKHQSSESLSRAQQAKEHIKGLVPCGANEPRIYYDKVGYADTNLQWVLLAGASLFSEPDQVSAVRKAFFDRKQKGRKVEPQNWSAFVSRDSLSRVLAANRVLTSGRGVGPEDFHLFIQSPDKDILLKPMLHLSNNYMTWNPVDPSLYIRADDYDAFLKNYKYKESDSYDPRVPDDQMPRNRRSFVVDDDNGRGGRRRGSRSESRQPRDRHKDDSGSVGGSKHKGKGHGRTTSSGKHHGHKEGGTSAPNSSNSKDKGKGRALPESSGQPGYGSQEIGGGNSGVQRGPSYPASGDASSSAQQSYNCPAAGVDSSSVQHAPRYTTVGSGSGSSSGGQQGYRYLLSGEVQYAQGRSATTSGSGLQQGYTYHPAGTVKYAPDYSAIGSGSSVQEGYSYRPPGEVQYAQGYTATGSGSGSTPQSYAYPAAGGNSSDGLKSFKSRIAESSVRYAQGYTATVSGSGSGSGAQKDYSYTPVGAVQYAQGYSAAENTGSSGQQGPNYPPAGGSSTSAQPQSYNYPPVGSSGTFGQQGYQYHASAGVSGSASTEQAPNYLVTGSGGIAGQQYHGPHEARTDAASDGGVIATVPVRSRRSSSEKRHEEHQQGQGRERRGSSSSSGKRQQHQGHERERRGSGSGRTHHGGDSSSGPKISHSERYQQERRMSASGGASGQYSRHEGGESGGDTNGGREKRRRESTHSRTSSGGEGRSGASQRGRH